MTREEKAAQLRRLLAEYRGCQFRVGGSGGAGEMMFVRYPDGKEYFIGGFHGKRSRPLIRALNLVLELIYEE